MDHDQRFKTLIREFFVDFLLLFFADWAARLDLTDIEWLDTEVFANPPQGSLHMVDLVARVGVSGKEPHASLLLVHIEIEAQDRSTELKARLPYYYHFLRDKHELPVLPIVLYLKVGLEGIGLDTCIEELWGLEVNRFQYLYVGLPGLDGVKYLQGPSWLGVALSALMRIPREQVAWLGAEALRRLAGAPLNEQQRFLLSECIQAYLPLDEVQRLAFEAVLKTESYEEVQAMNQTMYEKGIEKGIEKGRREAYLELMLSMLAARFGPVEAELLRHLEQMSAEDLCQLALQIPTAAALADLGLPHSPG